MKHKYNNSILIYYVVFMLTIVGLLSGGSFYFWKNGSVNIENVSSIFEANLILEQIQEREELIEIKKLVDNDNVRKAVRYLDKFEGKIKTLNSVVELENEYKGLETNFMDTKNSLNKLLSYPELSNIWNILHKKILGFEKYVAQSGWKTLTRVSRRLKVKLGSNKSVRNGFYNYSKISALFWKLKQDINYMKGITNSSILSINDKNLILTKLKTLGAETTMLKNYVVHLKVFNNSFHNFKISYEKWIKKIVPETALRRLRYERDSRNMALSVIGIVGVILLGIVFGIFLSGFNGRKGIKEIEKLIVRVVDGAVLSNNSKITKNFSPEFNSKFLKLKKYIFKRMSFGNYFQDSLPFSTLLFDSNLKLVWANKQFFSEWKLENYDKKDSITWDYLQKFTNLGENDPMISAVKENVAGIYQIQVRIKSNSDLIPYEMYVSPIESNGENKIMVFLYSLSSMEETLQNQAKSLVGPISRTLDSLIKSDFTKETKNLLKKDYEIADILNIFNKFEKFQEISLCQKDGLINEIERLENDLYDQIKVMADIQGCNVDENRRYKNLFNKFNSLKGEIISTVNLRQEMEQLYLNTIVTSKNLFRDKSELLDESTEIVNILEKYRQIFDKIATHRVDLKSYNSKIDESKRKILQSIDQTLHFKKSGDSNPRIDQSLTKLKMEMNGLDIHLNELFKISQMLDVSVSKSQIMVNDIRLPDLSGVNDKFNEGKDKIETDMFNVSKLTREGQAKDEDLIKTLKSLYSIIKDGNINNQSINELILSTSEIHSDNSLESHQDHQGVI